MLKYRLQLIVLSLAVACLATDVCSDRPTGVCMEGCRVFESWCPPMMFEQNDPVAAPPIPSSPSQLKSRCPEGEQSLCQQSCPSPSAEAGTESQLSKFSWKLYGDSYEPVVSIQMQQTADASDTDSYILKTCATKPKYSDKSFTMTSGYNFTWEYDYEIYDLRVMILNNEHSEVLLIPIPPVCAHIYPGECHACDDREDAIIPSPSNFNVAHFDSALNSDRQVAVLVTWDVPLIYSRIYPGRDFSDILKYYLEIKSGSKQYLEVTAKNNSISLLLNRSMTYSIKIKTYDSCQCGISTGKPSYTPPMVTSRHIASTLSHTAMVSTLSTTTCTSSLSPTKTASNSLSIPQSTVPSHNPSVRVTTSGVTSLSVATSSHLLSSAQAPSASPPATEPTRFLHPIIIAPFVVLGALVIVVVFTAVPILYFRSTCRRRSDSITVTDSKSERGGISAIDKIESTAFEEFSGIGSSPYVDSVSVTFTEATLMPNSKVHKVIQETAPVPDVMKVDGRCKQVLLIHSTETNGQEMKGIIGLYHRLGSYEGIQVNRPEVYIKNMYNWVEQKAKEADTILCVCNKEFEQEWERGNIDNSPVSWHFSNSPVTCLKQMVPALQEKIAVVLLYQTHSKYITSLALQHRRSFLFCDSNVPKLAQFVLGEPEYYVVS